MGSKKSATAGQARCHCGGPQPYANCCEPYISGRAHPETAEQLMRSRYSAFVVADAPYLLSTWHADTRPSRVRLDPVQRWLGLSIKNTQEGGAGAVRGTVEFVARFKTGGKGHRLHELSRFENINDRWYYRDGDHL